LQIGGRRGVLSLGLDRHRLLAFGVRGAAPARSRCRVAAATTRIARHIDWRDIVHDGKFPGEAPPVAVNRLAPAPSARAQRVTVRAWRAQSRCGFAPWPSRQRDADAGRSSLTRRNSPAPMLFVHKSVAVRAVT